jgi:hypothetical protein
MAHERLILQGFLDLVAEEDHAAAVFLSAR